MKAKRITTLLLAVTLIINLLAHLGIGAKAQGNGLVPGDIPHDVFTGEEVFGIINGDLALKAQPDDAALDAIALLSGHQIKILDFTIVDQTVWYQVEAAMDNQRYTGYIKNENTVSANQHFNEWKAQYGIDSIRPLIQKKSVAATKGSTNLGAFPASYHSYIQALVQAHPNWTFIPMNIGQDWSSVIKNEMSSTRNLVPTSTMTTWKSTEKPHYDAKTGVWTEYSGGGWVQASESIVKYQMDPRNFLNETAVFQFELLTFNSGFHKESGVEAILKNTFMSKKQLEDKSGSGVTYGQAFMKIGQEQGVSPYFLATRVRQEQGIQGNSELISGKYVGFKGYYNYFNIGATGLTHEEVVRNGLQEAKSARWNTRYKALRGGAQKAANNYIKRGQDTLYLQKFDVDASYDGLYYHQYMQNLLAAESEGKNVRNAYGDMGVLNNSFVFKVPVYKNMPSSAAKQPKDKLPKPTLKKSVTAFTKINLLWSEIPGASGYYIYKSDKMDSGFKRIKNITSVGTLRWSETVLPNQTFYYRVRAYKTVYGTPIYSPYSSISTASSKVSAPTWQSVAPTAYNKVKLTWQPISGVSGYRVYRKIESNGASTLIRTLTSATDASYIDTQVTANKSYYYTVRAFKKVGNKTYFSGTAATKGVSTKMTRPVIERVSFADSRTLSVKWRAAKWVTGYQLYRATTEKGTYRRVADITGRSKTAFLNKSLRRYKNYFYKVRSYVVIGGKKIASAFSNPVKGRTVLLRPAFKSIAKVSRSSVRLKWNPVLSADGYEVYRASSKDRKYRRIFRSVNPKRGSLTNSRLVKSRVYYYKVRAFSRVNGVYKYSKYSKVKRIRL